jgi:hypothetical protein
MLWYRFLGAAHWIYHGSQLIAGVCLGLLGLLDIGPKHLDITHLDSDGPQRVNPLYEVLFHEIPLVMIAMVYLVVYVGSGAAIWLLQRRQNGRSRGKETAAPDADRPGSRQHQASLGIEVDPEAFPLAERR